MLKNAYNTKTYIWDFTVFDKYQCFFITRWPTPFALKSPLQILALKKLEKVSKIVYQNNVIYNCVHNKRQCFCFVPCMLEFTIYFVIFNHIKLSFGIFTNDQIELPFGSVTNGVVSFCTVALLAVTIGAVVGGVTILPVCVLLDGLSSDEGIPAAVGVVWMAIGPCESVDSFSKKIDVWVNAKKVHLRLII